METISTRPEGETMGIFSRIYKCDVCGEHIDSLMFNMEKYAYRSVKKDKIFCSWTCMRKYEKENPTRYRLTFGTSRRD